MTYYPIEGDAVSYLKHHQIYGTLKLNILLVYVRVNVKPLTSKKVYFLYKKE